MLENKVYTSQLYVIPNFWSITVYQIYLNNEELLISLFLFLSLSPAPIVPGQFLNSVDVLTSV